MEETDRNVEFEDIDDAGSEMESTPLFWSQTIEKVGELVQIKPPANGEYIIHLTHASFGATVKNGSRSVVMITDEEDKEVPICVLLQGKHENEQLDLLINQPCQFTIRGNKPSTVYLTGYSQPDVSEQEAQDLNDFNDLSPAQLKNLMENGVDVNDDSDVADEEDAPQLINEDDDEDDDESASQEPPQKKQKLEKGGAKVTKQSNTETKGNGKKTGKKKSSKKVSSTEETTAVVVADDSKSKKQKKKDSKKGKGMQNMKGGIQFRDMKPGKGNAIKPGQKVTVHYVGQYGDKKPLKVFDKAISNPGFTFTFGKGDVIKGWEMGLKGAKVGTKRKLVIPSKLAYGSEGNDAIPPNTDLTFTIEVVSVQ